ncbi:amino acid [Ceraceosorus bombacis]|uniref:Amino acid n=1 Tax=Ceraceosorus bombacis TaxID=401625 RepID=A0A0P1BN04_9BASI|nr:amino acid [Ceraceosorus bombacis]
MSEYLASVPHKGAYGDVEDDRKSAILDIKEGEVEAEVSVTEVDQAFASLVAAEESHDIKHRTMGWKKTTLLLFGDQVCLAIMAQAWSFKVMGWVPGLITTILAGIFFYITSLTMWRFIMRHPGVRDVCDIGYLLFNKSKIAYEVTGIMLLLNNILLIGFHILTFGKILNTLSDHGTCTVVFTAIGAITGILMSLPRTLNHLTGMSVVSAVCMGIAIILFLVFAGIEANPLYGYGGTWPAAGDVVRTTAFPPPGTTWVECLQAALNIVFLWVPQILFPTFISEMKRPQDFPKALTALAILSFVLFIVPTVLGYHWLGQYATAPAFGSLERVYVKASFAFVIVPTQVISVIYSNVACKYIYQRIMRNSKHAHSHSKIGWGVWAAVTTVVWGIAFIFGSVIPSMGDMLGLLGAAFDSQFGFIFWALCWYSLYRRQGFFTTWTRTAGTVFHIIVMLLGLFLLGPGLYAAVEAIIVDYAGPVRPAFSCANLSL